MKPLRRTGRPCSISPSSSTPWPEDWLAADIDAHDRQLMLFDPPACLAISVAVLVDPFDVTPARRDGQQTVFGEIPEGVVVELRLAGREPLERVLVDSTRLGEVADVEQGDLRRAAGAARRVPADGEQMVLVDQLHVAREPGQA